MKSLKETIVKTKRNSDSEEENLYDSDNGDYANKDHEYIVIPAKKVLSFQCCKVDIHFETSNLENPHPGFYLRLDPIPDKGGNAPTRVTKAMK